MNRDRKSKRDMKQDIIWELIIARLENTINEDENKKLQEWLSDSKHQMMFDEISVLWKKIQKRSMSYNPSSDIYWEKISSRLNLPSVQKKKKTISINRWYNIAASIIILLGISLSLYKGLGLLQPNEQSEQQYISMTGKSQIELPDGTNVWLRKGAKLTYSSDFTNSKRKVELEGEAYFEVAKNKSSKFIVKTDKLDVIVYGTKFNVENSVSSSDINVSLLEGSVSIIGDNIKEECFLVPGETATYNTKSYKLNVKEDDVELNAAWALPTIHISSRTLKQVCDILSGRFDVDIEVSPDIADLYTYTFTLRDESVYDILELISNIHPIKYSYNNDGTIVITK